MASITISNLDDDLETLLKLQTDRNGRSIEDEAGDLLRSSLSMRRTDADIVKIFRDKFTLMDISDLQIPAREPMRDPPEFAE